MKNCGYRTALTLVEMLIVLAIISLLASLVLGIAGTIHRQGNIQLTKSALGLLKAALDEYHDYEGEFPILSPGETLFAKLDAVPAARNVMRKVDDSLIKHDPDRGVTLICDPWGTPIDYRYVEGWTFPELVSAGPDKTFGTGDDISSK